MVIVTKKTTTCLLSLQTLNLLHVREKKQNQENSANLSFCSPGLENSINLPHFEDVRLLLRLFIPDFRIPSSTSSCSEISQYFMDTCYVILSSMCRIITGRRFFLFYSAHNSSSPPNLLRWWILLINFKLLSNWELTLSSFWYAQRRRSAGIFCSN